MWCSSSILRVTKTAGYPKKGSYIVVVLFFCQIVGGLFFLDALFGLLFFSTVVFIFLFFQDLIFCCLFVCFFSCFFLRFSKSAAPQFFMVVFHIFSAVFLWGGDFHGDFFCCFFFILSGDLTISTVSTLYGTLWAQLNVLYM